MIWGAARQSTELAPNVVDAVSATTLTFSAAHWRCVQRSAQSSKVYTVSRGLAPVRATSRAQHHKMPRKGAGSRLELGRAGTVELFRDVENMSERKAYYLLRSFSGRVAMRTSPTLLIVAGTMLFGIMFLAGLSKPASSDGPFEHTLRATHLAVDGIHPAASRRDGYLKRVTGESPYMRSERY
jgi:hypothetical protein